MRGWRKGFWRGDQALFSLDLITTLPKGSNAEGVEAPLSGSKDELQANSKVGRMAAGAQADLFDPSTLSNGVVQGSSKRVGHEPEGIQKIALS